MARKYAEWINPEREQLLSKLIDLDTDSTQYAETMYRLGLEFGKIILDKVGSIATITLACTVEDADYLGRGMLDVLERESKVFLTVFWNKRLNAGNDGALSVAPIVKE